MNYYPVFLDLKGRTCLVVGGGAVAERKARSLLDAGAVLTVVSPSLSPGLRELSAAGALIHKNRRFDEEDLENAFLVVAATDDRGVNEGIAAACRSRDILVNSVTAPAESSFIVPSVVARGDLLIALSTSGSSPALARQARERLEREFGPEYAALLELLGRLRKELPARVADETARRRIYEAIVDSGVLGFLRQGDRDGAERLVRQIVEGVAGPGR